VASICRKCGSERSPTRNCPVCHLAAQRRYLARRGYRPVRQAPRTDEVRRRDRAYKQVRYALATGKLVAEACRICGGKAHAHHADYDRPLDVEWLCRTHHVRLHLGRL
jgi:uncharacterized OB-fold protein